MTSTASRAPPQAGAADARTPVSGVLAAAAAAPLVGPAVREAWARVRSGTSPLLHRFLLRSSPSADTWLARRTQLTRSLAAASMAGWLLGLGERAPHRLLLDHATAEVMHVGNQAILSQRPAARAHVGSDEAT